jgi:hypothetical protein
MIKLEKHEVLGWEHAIRGMRNPMNSWEKSDSIRCGSGDCDICIDYDTCPFNHDPNLFIIGDADEALMMKLANGGPVHAKYRRMITVYVDITAQLYWWKEFDTYKVGTVANSCSTMHKIHAKEFTLDDFSHEHLGVHPKVTENTEFTWNFEYFLLETIRGLNAARVEYLRSKDKFYWNQMIQLLPSSYNQKRTVMLNYEVLHNIYIFRKNHKLDEWKEFCSWIESLPCSEIITQSRENTSFQEDLAFFVNDCTHAQLEALQKRVEEKLKENKHA